MDHVTRNSQFYGGCTAAFRKPDRQVRVDNRPLVEINMKLFSLNEGAIHGYRRRHYRGACQTVEQGQTSLARSH